RWTRRSTRRCRRDTRRARRGGASAAALACAGIFLTPAPPVKVKVPRGASRGGGGEATAQLAEAPAHLSGRDAGRLQHALHRRPGARLERTHLPHAGRAMQRQHMDLVVRVGEALLPWIASRREVERADAFLEEALAELQQVKLPGRVLREGLVVADDGEGHLVAAGKADVRGDHLSGERSEEHTSELQSRENL